MRLYNTLSKKKEDFVPLVKDTVTIYYCGMTLQESPHIGHVRAVLTADILHRYLKYLGYNVKLIVNFTDIDDKVIRKAKEERKDYREIASYYETEYREVTRALNILEPSFSPRATQHIEEIIKLIENLEKKGFAYQKDGDVFFRVRKFKDYGKLSGKKIDELRSGVRIEVNEKKEDPLDFALWKKGEPSEPFWFSPWGKGRPGWHIECSSMAIHYLGETIDIHGGGTDLIFPHHENEIAQSESATGKPFARFWIHNGMLNIKGEKMSKSLFNFIPIKDLLREYDPNVIRLYLLQAHYRNPIDYAPELLQQAASAWEKIINFLKISEGRKGNLIPEIIKAFEERMNDDLGTPEAIALMFNLINEGLKEEEKIGSYRETLFLILQVLGFKPIEKETALKPLIDEILTLRKELRKEGNYKVADQIREVLLKIGIIVQDDKEGSRWWIR
ncbi:MAG: cysteine--tRNA ligase [candidate division WOR-3 bacterium]